MYSQFWRILAFDNTKMAKTANLSEIKLWLTKVLSSENLKEFSVKVEGNSADGDGYASDVIFVQVEGIKNGEQRTYYLALKTARTSAPVETSAIRKAFSNEMYFFDEIIPTFSKFELDKNINGNFENSVAKYFGKFSADDTDVIALQNLKKIGYALWDRKKALTRNGIDLVIGAYAQLHAISAALQDQRKQDFDKLVGPVYKNIFRDSQLQSGGYKVYALNVADAFHTLKGQVNDAILTKFKKLESDAAFIIGDMFDSRKFSVLIHGDCWNNNFMFYSQAGEVTNPSKVAVIDWQLLDYNTPIRDLAYCLFTCISKEDINDLDQILSNYHETFSDYLLKLGSVPEKIYPRSVFLEEWKKFAKFGILKAATIIKVALRDSDEVSEITNVMQSGGDVIKAFAKGIRAQGEFAERMKSILEYAEKNDLL